jgi:hypothetical protein
MECGALFLCTPPKASTRNVKTNSTTKSNRKDEQQQGWATARMGDTEDGRQ